MTGEIIAKNEGFFGELGAVKNIYILGHSLADVDWPYFEKVAASINLANSIWTVTFRRDDEQASRMERLTQLGLSEKQIRLIRMSDLLQP